MIATGRRLLPVLAAAGLIILLQQGLDLRAAVQGSEIATANGRLGLVTVLLTRGAMLLSADALLIMAAVRSRQPGALAGLAFLHLVVGVAALAGAPSFLADAGRMAGAIAAPQLSGFRITVARILGGLIALGVGGVLAGGNLVLLRGSGAKTG